jgi:hypothetical protein
LVSIFTIHFSNYHLLFSSEIVDSFFFSDLEPTQSSQSSATSSRQPQTTTSTEQKVSAEELRRRRLARFGGGGGGETMSSHISPSPPLSSTNTPPTNTTNLSSESSNVRVSSAPITIAARHTSRLVNTEPPAEPMEIETPFLTTHNTKTPTLTPPHSPLFLNSSSFSPSQPSYLSQSPVLFKSPPTSPLAVSPSSPLSVLPYEEWEHNTIKSILQISPSSNSVHWNHIFFQYVLLIFHNKASHKLSCSFREMESFR